MVGSIDPRCEPYRGTHRPNPGRVVDWSSRRGNHLGQRFKPTASTGRTYGCKRSDQTAKPLVPRGPSTYGSRVALAVLPCPGRQRVCCAQVFSFSQRVFARVLPIRCPSSLKRAQGKPGADCARIAVCNGSQENAHGLDRYSRDIPAFPAQWFTAYTCSPR